MTRALRIVVGLCAGLAGAVGVFAQDDFSGVRIESTKLTDSVYMLTGAGGNLGACVGEDGVFLIDDQFAPLTEKITAAIARLSDQPIRFVVNTHWHFDHTGGNENFGKAGAVIVAHENVRQRMSTDQFIAAFDRKIPAVPPKALPVITFSESVTFHWNGEELRVVHVEPAHTDGDSVIFFVKSNVVHMGDVYFNGMYPFIDTGAGGSIDGMIRAIDLVLSRPEVNDQTRFIPGHGPLSGIAELKAFRDMLRTAGDRVRALMAEGKSRDEVVAAKPTADLDAKWGGGFLQPDAWVGIVYDGMKR